MDRALRPPIALLLAALLTGLLGDLALALSTGGTPRCCCARLAGDGCCGSQRCGSSDEVGLVAACPCGASLPAVAHRHATPPLLPAEATADGGALDAPRGAPRTSQPVPESVTLLVDPPPPRQAG